MDLNLLLALDALLEHRSVQGAAAQLHVTAPAMSRTLGRIRRALGDDVLVRNGRQMVPTPRALAVRDDVRDLVQRSRAVLTPAHDFDPARLERVFTLRGNDALLGMLAPALLAEVASAAPGVSVRFLGEAPADRSELMRGEADLAVGGDVPADPGIAAVVGGDDRLVVAMRAGHPLSASVDLDAAAFADADHVMVSRRGNLRGRIDELLEERGLHRRVVASVPTASAALELVRRSDLVTVVAERLVSAAHSGDRGGAGSGGAGGGIVSRPAPFELPAVRAVVTWHHRHDSDPGHRWLVGLVVGALREVLEAPSA